MSGRRIYSVIVVLAGLLASTLASAQGGAYNDYTPYSVYGIGSLHQAGGAFNMGMGGIGIATRNKRFVNTLNPASLTARDSLSFMADFGLSGRASIYTQEGYRSANNLFNINNFVISFPLWPNTAMMVGISPYSNTGYDFTYVEQDQDMIGITGPQAYSAAGEGGLYQFFAGGAVTFWKRLSFGAEYIMYFGDIDKSVNLGFTKTGFRSIQSGHILQLRGSTAKFGMQYEQPLGGGTALTAGATYKLKAGMRGHTTDYAYATLSSLTDTLRHKETTLGKDSPLQFGDELGVGISLRGSDRWMAEINYTRSDWTTSGLDAVNGFSNVSAYEFSSSTGQSFRAGFEFTPNRNDIRYFFRRCTYRGGVYYDQSYYRLDGKPVDSYGITLGMTIPVFRGYNGVSVAFDLGKRGTAMNGMIRENYLGFHVGFNIFDIWFQKPRYE
jgi:hypothetical protein